MDSGPRSYLVGFPRPGGGGERRCPDCGGRPDDPQHAPEEGEEVGDLCAHPIHDDGGES